MKLANVGRFGTILLFAVVAACLLVSASARPNPAAAGYHLLKTISLPAAPGGDEYFDYISLDPDARRVYVSHGTEVVILNADDYSVVGKIGRLSRCHGIAIAKDLGKGFISDGDGRPSATVQRNTSTPSTAIAITRP
jgi:hypothetical protein